MENLEYHEITRKYLGAPMQRSTLQRIDNDIHFVTQKLYIGVVQEDRRCLEDVLFNLFELRFLMERAMGKYSGLLSEDTVIARRRGYLSAGDI